MKRPTLLVDIGNTRLKWACQAADHLSFGRPYTHHQTLSFEALTRLWGHLCPPGNIFFSSVAPETFQEVLIDWVRAYWGCPVHKIVAAPQFENLINGYEQPEKLGADRWLAMIAVRELFSEPLCLISAGTAITLDVIASTGKHLGGYIFPGLHTNFFKQLPHLRPLNLVSDAETDTIPRNTQQALAVCNQQLVTSAIDKLLVELTNKFSSPLKVVFTGGDGRELASRLSWKGAEYRSNCVLKGLNDIQKRLRKQKTCSLASLGVECFG